MASFSLGRSVFTASTGRHFGRIINNMASRSTQATPLINGSAAKASMIRCESTMPRVNQDRLMNDIHFTAQWGTGERWGDGPNDTGMQRLALSDADKQVRDWFADTVKSLGCSLKIDTMGNMFAVRPGKNEGPPTFAGSHLDTQPTGGRYDGILGVTAAIEMLRCLQDQKIETEYPVGVVNWTNEEGARFPKSMSCSGVWAGALDHEEIHSLKSVSRGDDATLKSELQRIGYMGDVPCSYQSTPMAAHFELHIEQGPILENEGRQIGVVEGVQAYRWFTIEVKGRDCHTGTTDLHSRSDALLAACKMIAVSREVALKRGCLASTGIIDAKPGSVNTVPGHVRFSLDIRATEVEKLKELEAELKLEFNAIAEGQVDKSLESAKYLASEPRDITQVNWTLDFNSDGTRFHDDCIKCVISGAIDAVDNGDLTTYAKRMTSGAGHDSVYTSMHCPTSMIFVPSHKGVSHNPTEYTSPEDCARGAQVLLGAVLWYDEVRRTQAMPNPGPNSSSK